MRHVAGYIRRSSVSSDSPGDASREAQQDAVTRLAAAFGEGAPLEVYADWGISGRRDDRPDYVRLKAAIEDGRVCMVAAYSLSRLGRTARELDGLFTLCERHGVQVVTQADGVLTATSATGRFLRRILAELAELESELAKERIGAALRAKRERGDRLGRAPFGFRHVKDADGRMVREPEPAHGATVGMVLDAYREAGSVLGAVRLLNGRGVPSIKGMRWGTSALTRIIETNAPELLPQRGTSGMRVPSSAIGSQLLRCHCGHTMTPNVHRRQYYCSRGFVAPSHGRYVVAESRLLPWLRDEAARLRVPADEVVMGPELEARREAIGARIDRAAELFVAGDVDRARYDAMKAAAWADMAALDTAASAVDIPRAIDWDAWAPDVVNGVLRSLWHHVSLDREMRPVAAEWRVPEWRVP